MLKRIRELLQDPKQENEITNSDLQINNNELSITTDADGNQIVNTYLSIPSQEIMLEVKLDMLKDEVAVLPPLKVGEIDIRQNYIYLDNDEIEVSGFLRNGTENTISFNGIILGIMDNENNLVAQQFFALGDLEEIPPGGARPCLFRFSPENVHIRDFKQGECKIVFQQEDNHSNTQAVRELKLMNPPPWMSEEQLIEFENHIAKLPIVLEGEFNIAGIDARYVPGQTLDALVLFRNGCKDEVNLSKMPLALIDLAGNEMAAGDFDLSHLTIQGHSSMLLNLTFDETGFAFEGEPDLSAWAVVFKDSSNDDLAS